MALFPKGIRYRLQLLKKPGGGFQIAGLRVKKNDG
jgi:hypothetical protein